MNTPLRRVATVMLVMFLALMGSATWVQFVQAPYTPWSDNHYWVAYGVPRL